MHDQGVADAVINYMQQTYLEAVRREEAISEIRRLVRRMNHDIGKTIFSVGSFMSSFTRNKRVRVNGHVLGRTRCTESRGSSGCAIRHSA
ncbi:MAG TPA: hypothetical protein VM783_09745, partial [Candidatus Acidoferrum sp.]|nr:hypothetical protein [Candidatus Acidoferrum sp.]